MKNFIELLISGTLAFILSICIIPVMRIIAQKFRLVDVPNTRKIHYTPTPLIGGLAIGMIILLLIEISADKGWRIILPIIVTSYILLLVGTLDDKTDIKAIYKLIIQVCVSIIIATSGIRISSLYGLFGIYEINTYFQYLLTVLVIVTAVNAFNLIDGVDGLAGSVAGIGFVLFFIIMLIEGNLGLARVAILFVGSIIAFLKYNLSQKNKIFLGNSGSLFLGYLLICLGIFITKFDNNTTTFPYGVFFILFVFTIPVIDSIRVYTDRILRGKSPFKADKTHIHHLLLLLGFSHKKISITFILINVLTFLVQYVFFKSYSIYSSLISFFIFIAVFKIIKSINHFLSWKKRIKELEYN